MSWWIHLLVRKVDELQQRVETLERVMSAVGRHQFVERTKQLLFIAWASPLCLTCKFVTNRVLHGCDIGDPVVPSEVYSRGSMYWWVEESRCSRTGDCICGRRRTRKSDFHDYISVYGDDKKGCFFKGGRFECQKPHAYELLQQAFERWKRSRF